MTALLAIYKLNKGCKCVLGNFVPSCKEPLKDVGQGAGDILTGSTGKKLGILAHREHSFLPYREQ